jgi:hypothetical protein
MWREKRVENCEEYNEDSGESEERGEREWRERGEIVKKEERE